MLDTDQYRKAGLGTLLAWKNATSLCELAAKADLRWHYHTRQNPLSEELKAELKKYYDAYPGCSGWIVWDEPKRSAMEDAAEVIAWIRQAFPDTLVYSNALPDGARPAKYYGSEPPGPYSYADYVRDFARIVKPDVLMFDIYPFRSGKTSREYFGNLEIVRTVALESAIPYWVFVQSWHGQNCHFPSESELRMQLFSSLAYGYTGIAYFTYDVAFNRGLLEPDGTPNRLYYQAARANTEVLNLGQTLRFLTSTAVYHVPGRHVKDGKSITNAIPSGTTQWDPKTSPSPLIHAITVADEGPAKNALVGFFVDDQADQYFMLVNLWHEQGASAAQRPLTVTIKFAPSVNAVARLSRETAATELLCAPKNTLNLTLPGGTGDLFKLDNAEFIGQ